LTTFDPVRIIEVLARNGVDFVVIGGFAAELYRAPVPRTQDIDVTPGLSEASLSRLSEALRELAARIRTHAVPEGLVFSHDARSLARASIWNLMTSAGDFDLSFRPSGTDGYEDLARNAVVVDLGGHDIAIAALADVVRSKEAAGRPKDLVALFTLRPWLESRKAMAPDDVRSGLVEALRQRQQGQ